MAGITGQYTNKPINHPLLVSGVINRQESEIILTHRYGRTPGRIEELQNYFCFLHSRSI